MIGTTAALIGMAAASAGSKVASSVIESKASNKTAKTQVAATKQVQQRQDDMWADYNKQMSPYLESGRNSMNLLGSLMLPSGTAGSYQPRPQVPAGPPQGPPQGPGRAILRGGAPTGPPPNFNPWGRPSGPPMPPPPQGPGGRPDPRMSPWGRNFEAPY